MLFQLCTPLYARRVHRPNFFLEQLAESVADPSIQEAINPEFFRDNWTLLSTGVKIGFDSGSFVEVRRTDAQI
ncbi:MAG: hypothetical protein NTZ48_01120, partial [Candidatus Omnitrophica bacterium]|nr:hypothetical protein [Candidatus Omnitrophota bacterium]